MDHDIGTYINDCVKRNNEGKKGAIAECKRLHNSHHVGEPRRATGAGSADEAPILQAQLVEFECRRSAWGKGDVRIVTDKMCTQALHTRLGESFLGELRPVIKAPEKGKLGKQGKK
jgi:hypothetical protein